MANRLRVQPLTMRNQARSRFASLFAVALSAAICIAASASRAEGMKVQRPNGKYAEVNGLKMYYEVHGSGKPLVLIHGAFGVLESWTTFLPALTKNHQVILVEMQGHGRTADIDRPLSINQMADDTAALLKTLNIEKADIFGYSMGGEVAVGLAVRHPDRVNRVAILGAGFRPMKETNEPESWKQFESIRPETFNFPQVKDPYTKVAPDPSKWPVLVAKIVKLVGDFPGYTQQEVRSIKAPFLVMLGDRDGMRVEHAVEMYRLLPGGQLAIFPGADHFLPFVSPDRVLGTVLPFLDGPAASPH